MKCPKCGYENQDSALSCNLCQEVLKKKEQLAQPESQFHGQSEMEQKPRKGFGWIIFIALIAFAALVYLTIRSKNTEKSLERVSTMDAEFAREVLQSDLPVMVDFWAPWCGPCQSLAPVISELEMEYEGKMKFYKVNIDNSPGLSREYSIRGIPALIFFKKGKLVDSMVGAYPKEYIKEKIESVLK